MKNVLIISSSLRPVSNSHILADAFARGAKEAGNNVEMVSLRGKDLKFCIGCLSCFKTGKCVIKDDAPEIVGKIHEADVVVLATPIYYYGISGQLKTLIDRATPLYHGDYKFTDVYLLPSAESADPDAIHKPIVAVQGWLDCFERAHLAGTVFAGGVDKPGEIEGHPSLEKAYQMGNAI